VALLIPEINEWDGYDGYLSLSGLLCDDLVDHAWFDKIPLHWRLVVKMHYGLGYTEQTFSELADIFGTDPETIRQMQNRAFAHLLDHFECARIQRDLEMKGWLELDED
jgi:hypothetical protein